MLSVRRHALPRAAGWSAFRFAARGFRRDRRCSVGTIIGLTALPLLMAVGMGVEVTYWTAVKLRLQRMADTAAVAGGQEYQVANNSKNAANAAANMAELNGATGALVRTWNATTRVLLDNQVTVQVTAGVQNNTDTAVKVTINQAVPLMLTQVISARPSVTVSANGLAEVIPRPQPCVLALSPSGTGLTAQGSVSIQLTKCTMRSNASISTGGGAALSAPSFYAAGTISGSETGRLYPNIGTVPDPYAGNIYVRSAFSNLAPGNGPSYNDKSNSNASFSPGTWSSWTIQGSVSLNPGIYYVNGPISIGAQGSLTGTGVTIISSGPFSSGGGSNVTLSAATPAEAAVSGAIAGVVFAGNSTDKSSFLGNTSPTFTGVVYYPNGDMDFGGTAAGGSLGCLEVIGASVTLKGNSSMAAYCDAYNIQPFSSDDLPPVVLVQ